jgi:hypothetical protein
MRREKEVAQIIVKIRPIMPKNEKYEKNLISSKQLSSNNSINQ